MKRSIYSILAVLALLSCQKELPLEPAISFFSASPEISEETAVFRLAYANIQDSTERVFPVTFSGTAEAGIDYTASGDRFVFGGENPVDSIVVTTLKLGTGKTLELTVAVPEGYASGKYTTSGYTLQDKLAYFSLDKDYRMMADSLEIVFHALGKDGRSLNIGSDAEISLAVNEEKSTAKEGIDFEFPDSSRFIIRAGENKGSLMIRSLTPHPEDDRDRIVLNLAFGDKYGEGGVTEIEISLIDTLWRHLEGSWNIDTLVTDSLYMDRYWKDICTGMELLPAFNGKDMVTFDMEILRMSPSFRSGFRNFFPVTSDIRKGEHLSLELGDGTSALLQTFMLNKTNRYFSSEQESEDRESLIGLRFFPETTDSLDFYVIDYVSRSFMPELETLGKYAPEKPVAASPGLFFNLTFTRQ